MWITSIALFVASASDLFMNAVTRTAITTNDRLQEFCSIGLHYRENVDIIEALEKRLYGAYKGGNILCKKALC